MASLSFRIIKVEDELGNLNKMQVVNKSPPENDILLVNIVGSWS